MGKTDDLILQVERTSDKNRAALQPLLEAMLARTTGAGPDRLQKFERAGMHHKLTRILAAALANPIPKQHEDTNEVDDEDEDDDPLVVLCSSIICNLSGPTARLPVTKTYPLPNGLQVVLREPDFADADVGWTTWPATRCLTEWLVSQPHLIRGKRIIEIGCGTAMAGIACALAGAEYVALTDYLPAIIKNTWVNLSLNGLAVKASQPADDQQQHANPDNLYTSNPDSPYETTPPATCSSHAHGTTDEVTRLKKLCHAFDLVVACECIYEESHCELVSRTLSFLLRNTPNAECYVATPAHEQRRPGVIRFEQCMSQLGFKLRLEVTTVEDRMWAKEERLYGRFICQRELQQIEH
ncbi:hypothetical protein, variant 1 [Capsaspora owczarzaki ATCC 30864]|uniref:Uncharacterized protein n=1 Tax=Capsaspora owczarzaki (strain ATCC 30864) TaxID=595528 RepID=A0A0D2WQD4_CAPO3|nr:hypothetical protein, variant 1 [Capsaspora owczarzaki ATCC 30864]